MWLAFAFLSAALLGFYDVFKKQSLKAKTFMPMNQQHFMQTGLMNSLQIMIM